MSATLERYGLMLEEAIINALHKYRNEEFPDDACQQHCIRSGYDSDRPIHICRISCEGA